MKKLGEVVVNERNIKDVGTGVKFGDKAELFKINDNDYAITLNNNVITLTCKLNLKDEDDRAKLEVIKALNNNKELTANQVYDLLPVTRKYLDNLFIKIAKDLYEDYYEKRYSDGKNIIEVNGVKINCDYILDYIVCPYWIICPSTYRYDFPLRGEKPSQEFSKLVYAVESDYLQLKDVLYYLPFESDYQVNKTNVFIDDFFR